jgi:hypothetical protein
MTISRFVPRLAKVWRRTVHQRGLGIWLDAASIDAKEYEGCPVQGGPHACMTDRDS